MSEGPDDQRRRGSRRSTLAGRAAGPEYLEASPLEAQRKYPVALEVYGAYVLDVGHRVVLERAGV